MWHVPRSNWMRRESTGAHFTLKLANSGMTSVGRARFKSPLAHRLLAWNRFLGNSPAARSSVIAAYLPDMGRRAESIEASALYMRQGVRIV